MCQWETTYNYWVGTEYCFTDEGDILITSFVFGGVYIFIAILMLVQICRSIQKARLISEPRENMPIWAQTYSIFSILIVRNL